MDVGLELDGVPLGVPPGVDAGLFTLAVLVPDLGVTLEPRKFFTGVDTSSFGVPFEERTGVRESLFRSSDDVAAAGDTLAASRGVTYGPVFALLSAIGATFPPEVVLCDS